MPAKKSGGGAEAAAKPKEVKGGTSIKVSFNWLQLK